MPEIFSNKYGKLYLGDAKQVLETLPKEFFHSCITSPPYWALRDYHVDGQLGQEPTFKEYIRNLCDYFDLVWDVLLPEGTLWVVLGDTYYGGLKGSGGKTEKQITNTGSFYNKNNKGAVLENARKFLSAKELPVKSMCLIPSRFAIEMQDRGWILRNDIIWHKPNKFPESCKDRFTMDYEHVFMFSKQKHYYFEQQLEPSKEVSILRAKRGWNGKTDSGTAWSSYSSYQGSDKAIKQIEKGRNKRSVWSINTESKRNSNHFASYPRKLIETPILASCPEGGTILDLFFGTGTTGVVAQSLGRNWVGIDLNEDYCKEAIKNLENIK